MSIMTYTNIDAATPIGTDKGQVLDEQLRTFKSAVKSNLAEVSTYVTGDSQPSVVALRTAVWDTAGRPTGDALKDRVSGFNTTLGYKEYYDLDTTAWKPMAASNTHTHNDGVPLGAIFAFPSATIPTNYLECNGAAVSRTTYSDLYSLIGTTYGSGDGSTTFNVPDYRGVFLRGWDHSRGVDSGRTLGSFQDQDVQPHPHALNYYSRGYNAGTSGTYGMTLNLTNQYNDVAVLNNAGTETRPKNVSVVWCIKAKVFTI
jgi:microcystin-dependent protein